MNERCEFFRRVFPDRNSTRFELQYCASPKGMSSDQGCGGYESFCKTGQFKPEHQGSLIKTIPNHKTPKTKNF